MLENNKVLISIITATKNSEKTILHCINSVSNQTYLNFEHVIIDGCSNDSTVSLVKNNLDSNSVTFISEPDNGIYDALNKGILISKGDVIGFLHSDDFYQDTEVLTRISKAFEDPNVSAVYGDLQYVSSYNINKVVRHWRSSKFRPYMLRLGWMPPHPTLYVRREWFLKTGFFDTNYRISSDYLSILRMFSQRDFRPLYLPTVLVKMRLGGVSNRSLRNLLLKSREDLRAIKSVKIGGFITLILKNVTKITQY